MVIEHFDNVPTVTNRVNFICCVKCKNTIVCKRISLVTGGGKHFSKTFFSMFSYMLNSKTRVFNQYFLIDTCPIRKKNPNDQRVETTILSMEK